MKVKVMRQWESRLERQLEPILLISSVMITPMHQGMSS